MFRILIGLLGAVLAARPDDTITVYESIAFESAGDATPKPWIESVVRAEGVAYLGVALLGGRPYRVLASLVGVIGAIVLAVPRQYLDVGAAIAYDRPDDIEWSDGFVSAVRAIGACCVLVAIAAVRGRQGEER
ncbi:hypothetical protein [Halopenitus sp. POP-27]|uniref:hypothetical protein n=1 Tax=Halopenitus sp. POP-27 TaxID=2994425 RepID=UPI002469570A|nr:hypothetical protein [Halopenitus sp. POP-27]